MSYSIDPKEFRSWLESQDPDLPIGQPVSADSCPLARYVHSRGASSIRLSYAWIAFDVETPERRTVRYQTPHWASEFMRAIDAHQNRRTVTVGIALYVLNQVEGVTA